ncbi:hypothetical protein [Ramlibacter sp.]|uniref:hypothetical protein n=1 Tax=Ramlibacter sp. TaxID=1917967 RepID=UPI003D0AB76A
MFKIAVQPHFWQVVNHEVVGDLGESIKLTFKCKFRRPTQDEKDRLIERIFAPARALLELTQAPTTPGADGDVEPVAIDIQPETPITDAEIVRDYLLDWADVLGDDDAPLPFTPDNLERAHKVLGVREAIVRRFLDNFLKAPEKNFAPPLARSTR